MSKAIRIIYGVYCYLITGIVLIFFIGFYENLFLGKTVSLPLSNVVGDYAVLIDFGLLVLFGLQHSVMSRKWFKKWWTQLIPASIERATYLLLSSLALALVIWQWQPFGQVIWDLRGSSASVFLYGLSFTGLLIILISVFSIDALRFMGWRQLHTETTSESAASTVFFITPLFYKIVRHPIYFGFLITFWCTPLMTWSHLLFGIGMTIYIIIGAALEERDLVEQFGVQYLEYRQYVAMLIPFSNFKF